MESKLENLEQSSLEEKVDLGNLVLFSPESYTNEEIEEENFRIKDEPDHKYEKLPIEFSTNDTEQNFRDLFCFQCSLQFHGQSVYDLHQSLFHGSKDLEIKTEIKSDPESSDDEKSNTQSPILPVDEEFKCNNCNAGFSSRIHLNRHVESVHKEKKLFECNICDVAFSVKANLNVHIKSVHKGKKPFKCNICDTAFSRKKHLNGHIESVHE